MQPIRTAAQITASIKILPVKLPPLYQKLTRKVKELHLLGLPYKEIAKKLGISQGTITNALKYKGGKYCFGGFTAITLVIPGKEKSGLKSGLYMKLTRLFWFIAIMRRFGFLSRGYIR